MITNNDAAVIDFGSTTAQIKVSTDGVELNTSSSRRALYNGTEIATTDQVYAKQDRLVSGTNIKTINGHSILGAGDIDIDGNIYPEKAVIFYQDGGSLEYVYNTGIVPDNAFLLANNVSVVRITEGITEIGDSAFETTDSMSLLYLPSTLRTIGTRAFSHNHDLTAIVIDATIPPTL